MLTGVTKDILDALLRGEGMDTFPKCLRKEIIATYEAREHSRMSFNATIDQREQAVMAAVERHIIKSLGVL